MTNSQQPVVREKSTLTPSASGIAGSNLPSRFQSRHLLILGGTIATISGVGFFLLTQFTLFSVLLAIVGFLFFAANQLIKKSLALTNDSFKNSSEASTLALGSTQDQLEQIRKQVSKCKFLENLEIEGTQTANQGELLWQQYKNLKSILLQKFDPAEITFSRYLESIDSSCLSIGENLLHTKRILENLNLTFNLSLNTKTNPSTNSNANTVTFTSTNVNADTNSITANKVQIQNTTETQRAEAAQILKTTDLALQELQNLFHSLNQITTNEKHRDQLEQSMQQIKELADRAKLYSIKN